MMYKGEPTKGIKFYNLLLESKEFTSELGKVTMAAGKLEAKLILFLRRKGINSKIDGKTLGFLIRIGEKNNLFDKNLVISLNQIKNQRNYLMHNIYALHTDLIEETILEKRNLLDTDVTMYIDRTWQLKENLNDIANIF